MKNILTRLKLPAILSFLLVAPFMLLEWVNRRNYQEGYPLPLFAVMWLLPLLFMLILALLVRDARAGKNLLANPLALLLSLALLALIAWLWAGLLLDQLPCFLGVPNCD